MSNIHPPSSILYPPSQPNQLKSTPINQKKLTTK